ncbi:NADPH-dependent cytochrome P450 oxidoreductase [Spinellus fusiger]|nr:NADPH-dependent cytochrome P450 oxidoreductase [Spinellus fusiger]
MAKESVPMLDASDILTVGAIGLATLAWFTRNTIKAKLYPSPPSAPVSSEPTTTKKERNFVNIMQKENRQVIFFYGSQTGTAEDYASRLAKECTKKYGVSCMTADIEMYDLTYLDTVPSSMVVVFVLATYGEGEPTDSAVEFWDLIKEESPMFSTEEGPTPLSQLRYMIFGLGNKTYEKYNEVGRIVNQRLTALGAHRLGAYGEGDDNACLEEDFLSWQEEVWPVFCEALGVEEVINTEPRKATFTVVPVESPVYLGELGETLNNTLYNAKNPFLAPYTSRGVFEEADRHCLHLEFDISQCNLTYQTGDHLALWPSNNDNEIQHLAQVLGIASLESAVNITAMDITASKKHPFPVPTTYRAMFRHYLDICAPVSRQTLIALVDYLPEPLREALRTLATDKDAYRLHVSESVRNLAQTIQYAADSVAVSSAGVLSSVPFDLIIESIPRLQPRYYSISSSSKESPDVISATVVTLAYQPTPTPHRTVYGVATHFLLQKHSKIHTLSLPASHPTYDTAGPRGSFESAQGPCLPVHVRKSTFKLPRSPSLPVIMIGPGTGVAPFRAFVRERVHQKAQGTPVGPTLLFFGSRTENDFLYANEWPGLFESLGEGSRIITAFSRTTAQKVYVQHRLQEAEEEVWQLLNKGAYLYVCGDARTMAKDVQQTLVAIATRVGQLTDDRAHEFIKNMRNTGRYQEDVWS